MTEYNGLKVKTVSVRAIVQFDAYIVDPEDAEYLGEADLPGRIAQEIADALEHHAPHLSDTEPNDALIALIGGGSGNAANVTSVDIFPSAVPFETTDADVERAVGDTEAWK